MTDRPLITGPRAIVIMTRGILWGFFGIALIVGMSSLIGGLISQAGVALAGRFDPTLTVFGIVLLLVGFAFEYGTRLQKETDGLV